MEQGLLKQVSMNLKADMDSNIIITGGASSPHFYQCIDQPDRDQHGNERTNLYYGSNGHSW